MDTLPPHQPLRKQVIHFPNGNRAQAVIFPIDAKVTDLVYTLILPQHRALIMIAGGAAQMIRPAASEFSSVFPDAIAHIAASLDALIIDGGTQAGVMALIGLGVAHQRHKPTLLGVAPAGTVTYPGKSNKVNIGAVPLDPNHSHFVLVETDEWGGETETMYELARVFSQRSPSLALLVNGGTIAKSEVLCNVRQRRPIIIFEGSGRLADELANMIHRKASSPSESEFSEIIAEGDLHLFPPTGTTADFEQLAQHLLDTQ